jgi:hypothetical protein
MVDPKSWLSEAKIVTYLFLNIIKYKIKLPNTRFHSVFHVIFGNQLAEGIKGV